MVSCLMGDSTALASAIVRCCHSFSLLGHAQQNCLHIPLVNRKKQFENIEGLRTGRKRLVRLIESISTEALSADRSYDANDIPVYVISAGMEPIILP